MYALNRPYSLRLQYFFCCFCNNELTPGKDKAKEEFMRTLWQIDIKKITLKGVGGTPYGLIPSQKSAYPPKVKVWNEICYAYILRMPSQPQPISSGT